MNSRFPAAALIACALTLSIAQAHTVSDSYLTINVAPVTNQIKGQLDVSLRDLQFALDLDGNGDGKITWGELHKHQPQIAKYVYPHLKFSGAGKSCQVEPDQQLVDHHADGDYDVLMFDVDCGDELPTQLLMTYSLFFATDPSHRGIFVMNDVGQTSTAVLSPANTTIKLRMTPASSSD